MDIEIRCVIHFLWLKGNTNKEIYESIIEAYGENSISLRTVQDRTQKCKQGDYSIFDLPRSGRPPKDELVQKIKDILQEDPYLSTKKISKKVGADSKTVKKILTINLSMSKVNFKWVPYQPTPEIKAKRVEIAQKLYNFLSNSNERKLNKVLTQDESWFYLVNQRNSMWLENGRPRPFKVKQTIGAKKLMVSFIWGRTGFKGITMLPIGQKFNKAFFSENVLGDLAKSINTKGYFLHLDNARPHLTHEKYDELGIIRLDHPAYSPDLAPSDFFLFGYLKKLLEGQIFDNENELFEKIKELSYEIPTDVLKSVYDEWIKRLLIVIEREGDYIY